MRAPLLSGALLFAAASATASGPGAAELREQVKHAKNWRGNALSAPARKDVLAAIARLPVDPRHKRYVAAHLAESAGPMYGPQVTAALAAAALHDHEPSLADLAPGIAPTLAVTGCSELVAQSAGKRDGAAAIAANCPPPPAPRWFAAPDGSVGWLLLALVMEHHARTSGFSDDPLHRTCVDIFLGPGQPRR